MDYNAICGRDGWSMSEEEFNKFVEGGEYLEDSAIRDILKAQKADMALRFRQIMDPTFLNYFVQIVIGAGDEAAVEFARSSPMGQCQDSRVIWAMPYNIKGEHWVTVVICRQDYTWGVVDSIEGSRPYIEYLYDIVGALIGALPPAHEEPDEDWLYVEVCGPGQKQSDSWSCGIHTAENLLYFLNGGDMTFCPEERRIDIGECRERYFKAFVQESHPEALTAAAALANLPEDSKTNDVLAATNDAPVVDTTPIPATPADKTSIDATSTDASPSEEVSRLARIKDRMAAAKSNFSSRAKTITSSSLSSPSSSEPLEASSTLDLGLASTHLAFTALDTDPFRDMGTGLDLTSWEEEPQPQDLPKQNSDYTEEMGWNLTEQEAQELEASMDWCLHWNNSFTQDNHQAEFPLTVDPPLTIQPPTFSDYTEEMGWNLTEQEAQGLEASKDWCLHWNNSFTQDNHQAELPLTVDPPSTKQPLTFERFIQPVAFNRVDHQSGQPLPQLQLEIPQPIPFNDFGFGSNSESSTPEFGWTDCIQTNSNLPLPFSDSPSPRRYQSPYQPPF